MFPCTRTSLFKYILGASLRYLTWQFSQTINNGLFDQYCDIIYIEYIPPQTMYLCEYRPYVEMGMKWFLDFINQILAEDGIEHTMNKFRDEMHQGFTNLHAEMHQGFTNVRAEIKELQYQLHPSLRFHELLTPDDLTHE